MSDAYAAEQQLSLVLGGIVALLKVQNFTFFCSHWWLAGLARSVFQTPIVCLNIRARLRPPDFGTPGYEDTVFQTGEWLQGCGEIAAPLEVLRFIFWLALVIGRVGS